MSKIVEVAFDLRDKVRILEIDLNGVVISTWITCAGTRYSVRYFWHCKAEEVYFYEDELELI